MAVLLKWLQKLLQIAHNQGNLAKVAKQKVKKSRKKSKTEGVQLVEFNKFNHTQVIFDEDGGTASVHSNTESFPETHEECQNASLWPAISASEPLKLNEIEKIEELDVNIETIRAMRKRSSVQITSIFDVGGGYFHMSITSNLNMNLNTADYFASSQISAFIERIKFDQQAGPHGLP